MFPHLETVATVRSREHELALQRSQQRSRLVPSRTRFLPLACLLALLTGGTLLILAAILAPAPGGPVAASGSTASDIAVVRAFYAAVNDVLRTGNPVSLDAVVGSDLVEHADRAGFPAGRDGLTAYLAALRAAYPGLQYETGDLIGDSGQVSVRVTAQHDPTGSTPNGPVPLTRKWSGVDVFQVVSGRVVERWSGSDAPHLLQPLARVPVEVGLTGASVAAIARFTYAPGAGLIGAALPGPGLAVVESGSLTVRGNGVAQVSRGGPADEVTPPTVIPPGTDAVLRPGDVVAFPQGTSALRNDGLEPAVVLVVAWFPAPGSERFEQTLTRQGEPTAGGVLALAMLPMVDGGQPANLPGITVAPLGRLGLASVPPGPAVVALERVLLGPGASLPPRPARGPVLLAVEAGAVGLVPVRETAQVRAGGGKTTVTSTGIEVALAEGDIAHWDGGGVALIRGGSDSAGAGLLLAITTDAPVRILP